VPLDKQPRLVRFDPEYTLLAKIEFRKSDAMVMAQMDLADDVIGRLLAVEALENRKTAAAVERLGQALREDAFFGVRVAAAQSLRKIGDERAFQQLTESLTQSDARVRREVVQALAGYYRPEALEHLQGVLEKESNPLIRGDALRALAKFQQPATRRQIVAGLRAVSFGNHELDAAVDAIAAQNDPSYQRALLRMLETRSGELSSRALGNVLGALGKIGRFASSQTQTRELISSFVHDSRPRVQSAALSALGALGDPLTEPLLRSFAQQEGDPTVSRAAETALRALEEQKPITPAEVNQLRQQVRDLQDQQKGLNDQLQQLQSMTKALRQAAPEQHPAAAEDQNE
jgi:aminopeptidase N